MGITGLDTFIENHKHDILKDYRLRSTSLIIDGHNVCQQLFYTFQHKNCLFFGGDYDDFEQVCKKFFDALKECKVTLYVIYDGAHDKLKFETMRSRAEYRIKTADDVSKGTYGKVTPVMSYETFRDVVSSSDGIHHVTCNFEADHQIAALAIQLKCPILSMDTDFLIYDLPHGVVRMNDADVKTFVDGDKENPTVKIYSIRNFCQLAGGIDPSILPLWATLLGNDRVDSKLFKKFFDKVKLPNNCGDIKAGSLKDRVVRVLGWLRECKSVENAMEILLSKYSGEEMGKIKLAIQVSMAVYELTDLTCTIDPKKLIGGVSLKSLGKRAIPDWFMKGIWSGEIPAHALDALVLRQVVLPTQVSVTSQLSPYQCSVTLRRFLYSVLLRWDDELKDDAASQQLNNSCIVEFDRGIKPFWGVPIDLKETQVGALVKLESGSRVPTLEEIPGMTESARNTLLLEVLGVTKDQLNKFDERIHLLIATIVHWMRNSDPPVNQLHLESLLVCLHRAGILGNPTKSLDPVRDSFLDELRKAPDVISSQNFDCAVVHSFAQFQCCLQMALYVNQILLLPAPQPLPVLAFNGTFLHNFYRKLVELRGRQPEQQRQRGADAPVCRRRDDQSTKPQPLQPLRSSTAGVKSENLSPLESACKTIEEYKDKLIKFKLYESVPRPRYDFTKVSTYM